MGMTETHSTADTHVHSPTDPVEPAVSQFLSELSTSGHLNGGGQFADSHTTALATVNLLKRLIGQSKWHTAQELMGVIRASGARLTATLESQVMVANLFRRTLKLVREEYASALKGRQAEDDPQESLHKMVEMAGQHEGLADFGQPVPDLKTKVIESVDELLMEMEAASEEIANQSLEHIHANEIILTVGRSRTVELFLKQAAQDRQFHVIVAECAPFYQGQAMAASLAQAPARIKTTVITDTAVFAMMSRVNKVIIGTHVILANGGLKALSGSYTVALAAQHFSVPMYVCASIAKLTPGFCTANDQETFNEFASPEATLRHLDGGILSRVRTVTPIYEYVPPDLVTLFVSNVSAYAPSYVYRLLSELYHPEDYDLSAPLPVKSNHSKI
ncbi:hypothetical protein TCAL_03634 [Tigriopus californicus]|uniref:Translation initiation factor eIF2B subunit beta n=1 Tax=Tigriopus californicus TaxID=6832 RepID=A0A553NE79_TIGCA|nr:translation initiation factor eIF-2B subunit beta-like [Tigriopus californicus]TRY63753.1 hypothetical protein TCAL_03634 [Tigriopus californicus]|eukprot:TCALIF_03634-PA protein Name:"Similar to eif2b2 Translation initiation factor eIF-2B subunit beta (Takifugu rubripes)" AED:0.03 eAED:0.03 QI:0/-1/0/1/-1/1/1/0/388